MAGETMLDFTKEELEWFRRGSEIKYELDMRQMLSGTQDEGIVIGEARGREGEAEEIREEILASAR
jgi:hypothetical protein